LVSCAFSAAAYGVLKKFDRSGIPEDKKLMKRRHGHLKKFNANEFFKTDAFAKRV
jgi:hypothetical protein